MRIALAAGARYPCPGPQHSEWAYVLADALGCLGHEVHLLAPGGSLPPYGGHVHVVPGMYGLYSPDTDEMAYHWYGDVLKGCDVVHDLTSHARIAEQLYLDDPAAPYVISRIQNDFRYPRIGCRNVVLPSLACRVLATAGAPFWTGSVQPLSEGVQDMGTYAGAEVVTPAVDLDFYTPDDAGPTQVLFVGRPHPSHGVEAALDLARGMPDVPFTLAWLPTDPEEERWDSMYRLAAADLPNVQVVRLPQDGYREAKRGLYRRARCLLALPSMPVAWVPAAAEALACGTPVVGNENVPAEVRPYPGSLDDLLAAGDGPRSDARAWAESVLTPERMARQYEALYERAAGGDRW